MDTGSNRVCFRAKILATNLIRTVPAVLVLMGSGQARANGQTDFRVPSNYSELVLSQSLGPVPAAAIAPVVQLANQWPGMSVQQAGLPQGAEVRSQWSGPFKGLHYVTKGDFALPGAVPESSIVLDSSWRVPGDWYVGGRLFAENLLYPFNSYFPGFQDAYSLAGQRDLESAQLKVDGAR